MTTVKTEKFQSWFDRTHYKVRVTMVADDGFRLASGDSDVYPPHVGECVAVAQAMARCMEDYSYDPRGMVGELR